MQHCATAQLQMNGTIYLVTRGRRERLQPNCTWSPVLTPARRFPLRGKVQRKREGEKERIPAPSSTSPVPPELISLPIIPRATAVRRRTYDHGDLASSRFLALKMDSIQGKEGEGAELGGFRVRQSLHEHRPRQLQPDLGRPSAPTPGSARPARFTPP
ncbi:hypothetical protein E1301_Tti001429 [Triplophysa tibetana]|uniref:Uncharacterized protein n=1 Tax=Triplophysa tibetana TaxID=1572043 RepID=A0A5A9PBG1_9TELE|nr:hypothetical protein E1301_Tti001429 [Triplophysa tibetana]